MTERARLMSSWVTLQENWWAHEELHDRCESDPEFAWDVLLGMIENGLSQDVLEVTAAGPLEDLLRIHASLLIDRVEAHAKKSARLREALAIVRVPDAGDGVSNRLLALGCVGLPARFATIERLSNEAMLAWAAEGGLIPDPRYPDSHALVFEASPDCWCAWPAPHLPGELPTFVDAAITCASADAPYYVRLRGGGAFCGDILSPLMREQVLGRVVSSLHLSRDMVGGLTFHRYHRSSLILLATTFFTFGYRAQTDLEIIPADRRVCLMLEHHGSLIAHFASDEVMRDVTAAMRRAGYIPEGER
jgi:hypothetical protein